MNNTEKTTEHNAVRQIIDPEVKDRLIQMADLQMTDLRQSMKHQFTKRESIAVTAMNAYLTVNIKRMNFAQRLRLFFYGDNPKIPVSHGDFNEIAANSIRMADELLKQLRDEN